MFDRPSDEWNDRAKGLAVDCLSAGIERAHPETVIDRVVDLDGEKLTINGSNYDLSDYESVYVVGGGNAAGHVVVALEDLLGDHIASGAVVTDDPVDSTHLDVLEGDHPVPSRDNVAHASRIRELTTDAGPEDIVITIVGGGGSALITRPVPAVSLPELQETTDALLRSGASIDEINAVRKHLSTIKGGRLAAAASPATVVGVIFSDVVGDDLETIASGPTTPDSTTYGDAVHVLDAYDVDVPAAVQEYLEAGTRGENPETPSPDNRGFEHVTNHVLVSGYDAVAGAAARAEDEGVDSLILSSSIRGEAREAALSTVAVTEEIHNSGNPVEAPVVVVSGGETTVTVRGNGEGGPNQEFALSAATELADDVVLASVDTDGIDGATDAAGALVDAKTIDEVRTVREALANNDAYTFLKEKNALLKSGPTGTNVNDLRVAVVGPLASR